MNIFIAGIHGVGKTYLAQRLPSYCSLLHTSASTLIREERALPEWNTDKRVADVDENQIALSKAVARHNTKGTALLLDGHFVLLSKDGQFISLGVDVFKALNLNAVVLIEAPTDVIASRVTERDAIHRDPKWLTEFMAKERAQAELVCADLNIPLTLLISPSDTEFAGAVGIDGPGLG